VTTNPFSKDLEALQREHEAADSELKDWKTKAARFHGFNMDQASASLGQTERAQAEMETRLEKAQKDARSLVASIAALKPKTDFGFDPRYWVSSERAIAVRQVATREEDLKNLKSTISNLESEIKKSAEIRRTKRGEIAAARASDPLLAQSAIAALEATLQRIEPRLASLRQRHDDLENLLREPLASLHGYEAERLALMKKISQAEHFNLALSRAGGAERKWIHGNCERELGHRSPNAVIERCEGKLRGVEGSLEKIRLRVETAVLMAQREIRHIVIDGSNLCYVDQGSRSKSDPGAHHAGQAANDGGSNNRPKKRPTLVALEALVPVLAKSYEVTLIFDANIRHQLHMSDRDFEARFPQARVHVLPNGRQADEPALIAAEDDAHTFVLSNDGFRDYPEKRAVKEKRLLQHLITERSVHIFDLHITIPITFEPETRAA